jgi:hypothetical protein
MMTSSSAVARRLYADFFRGYHAGTIHFTVAIAWSVHANKRVFFEFNNELHTRALAWSVHAKTCRSLEKKFKERIR